MKRFFNALGSMSVKLNRGSEQSAHWMSEPCAAAAAAWFCGCGFPAAISQVMAATLSETPSCVTTQRQPEQWSRSCRRQPTEATFLFRSSSSPAGGFR